MKNLKKLKKLADNLPLVVVIDNEERWRHYLL